VQYNVAYAASINRFGEVHILSKAAATTTSSAVDDLANLYMGYRQASFQSLGASAATFSEIDAHVTSSTAQCHEVTLNQDHPNCLFTIYAL